MRTLESQNPSRFIALRRKAVMAVAAAAAAATLLAAPAAEAQRGGGSHGGGVSRGSSHGSTGYRGGSRHTPSYGRYHYRGYYGGWGWGWWGPGYWWGPWGPSVYVYGRPDLASRRYGMVKTDIEPEEAEVWLDGTYIGTADDFDGFPDYLYLRPGSYHVEFRHPRYETLAMDLKIERGRVVRLNDEMKLKAGRSKLDSFDTPKHEGTPLGRYFGPKATPDRVEPRRDRGERDDADDDSDVDVRRDRDEEQARPKEVESIPRDAERAPAPERTRLRWKVSPEDAAVYLDDRYIGAGDELNASPRGTRVEPGKHTITVLRPGYKSKTVEVESKAGAAVDVVVELEK